MRWKGVLLLVLACISTDMFFIFGPFFSEFLHSVAGFTIIALALSAIFYPFLGINSFLLSFSGVTSHALGDFIENAFPQTNLVILGISVNVSFMVSVIPLVLLVIIYTLKMIEVKK